MAVFGLGIAVDGGEHPEIAPPITLVGIYRGVVILLGFLGGAKWILSRGWVYLEVKGLGIVWRTSLVVLQRGPGACGVPHFAQ